MNKNVIGIAKTILDGLANNGFNFGDEEILKTTYDSLRLLCNEDYTDEDITVGAFFMLLNDSKGYAYVIGREGYSKFKGAARKIEIPGDNGVNHICYASHDGNKMTTYGVGGEGVEDITIEEVMIEMKNIIADAIVTIYGNKSGEAAMGLGGESNGH